MKQIDKLAGLIRVVIKDKPEFSLYKDILGWPGNRFEQVNNIYTYIHQRSMNDSFRSINYINYELIDISAEDLSIYLEKMLETSKLQFRKHLEGRIYIGDSYQMVHDALNHAAYEIRFTCFGNGTELFVWEE